MLFNGNFCSFLLPNSTDPLYCLRPSSPKVLTLNTASPALGVYSERDGWQIHRGIQMASQKYSLPFLLLMALSACAAQRPLFDANQIANNSAERSNLTGKKGAIHATVNTNSVRVAIAAKNKVEKAAGSLRAQFWIDPEEKPNAYAWYNKGQPAISFNIGILQILGEDEEAYAALASHEFAHLYLDHNAKKAERESANKGASVVLGFVLGFVGIPGGGVMTDVATSAMETVYSQEDEQEADALGVKYMLQAGYNPQGAVRFQEKLKGAGTAMLPFLSSHPSGNERIKDMGPSTGIAHVMAQPTLGGAKSIDHKSDAPANTPSEMLAPTEALIQ